MSVIETASTRKDLPLLVIPSCMSSMVEPFRSAFRKLDNICRVRLYTDSVLDEETIASRCKDADSVVVIGFRVSDALLERLAPHVHCMVFGGTGVANYINLAEAKERGIRVCNIEHYGDSAVAEHTVALMFELARRAGYLDQQLHEGKWVEMEGIELNGKALGLIGFGGIGKAVARIARGLGMRITVCSRHEDRATLDELGASWTSSIDEVMESSDVISLHLALNEQTKGMVTSEQLAKIHSGAMLINTARAELIEQGALAQRLNEGDVLAGLDVFDEEPMNMEDPLLSMPNVVLTPHVAWFTKEAVVNVIDQCFEGISAFYRGEQYNVVV
ncbi:MAG: NAD(P)-binding domain-containing protein [Bifidobacterium sp.]|jgi:phosphoglycerate dehydrogenase-like enzyme|nr:NAD(P)-binding domain-containing protein [Bifidobacterium sp.]